MSALHEPIIGSKAGNWANQALDYAYNTASPFVAVAYLKPPPTNIYDLRSRWVVYMMPTRQDLDNWYRSIVDALDRYHYIAAYDKTASEWHNERPVASAAERGAYTSGDPRVGSHLAPETYRPAAVHAVTRRAHPGDVRTWLYVALADGNRSTRAFDDYAAAINAIAPYFRAAAAGMMEDVLYWAALKIGPSGPEILRDAVSSSDTVGSVVKALGSNGRGEYGQKSRSTAVGSTPSAQQQLHHLDQLVALHETYWAAYAQHHPTPQVRAFLQQHWDPFLTWWFARRHFFDTPQGVETFRNQLRNVPGYLEQVGEPPKNLTAAWVNNHALKLSELREIAADNGIPTPDLGTTQHGFVYPEASHVAGIFDDIFGAAKGAISDVAKVIQHPPGWLAVAMPLFTPGTQKWWAKKVGGKTGEQLYDVGTQAVVQHALGPAGPKLLSAFNSVMDDAAKGHSNAKEMIAKAPQIAHLALAAKQSPQALQQAIAATASHVTVDLKA